jgi:hypothetical protein
VGVAAHHAQVLVPQDGGDLRQAGAVHRKVEGADVPQVVEAERGEIRSLLSVHPSLLREFGAAREEPTEDEEGPGHRSGDGLGADDQEVAAAERQDRFGF